MWEKSSVRLVVKIPHPMEKSASFVDIQSKKHFMWILRSIHNAKSMEKHIIYRRKLKKRYLMRELDPNATN